jgi:hypothetical protein
MSTTLTVDLLISVDGWAGADGLPGNFGYLGPELEEWFAADSAATGLDHGAAHLRGHGLTTRGAPRRAVGADNSAADVGVLSHPDTRVDWPNARVCHEDLAEEIRRLKAESDVPLRTIGSLSVAQ